VRWPKGWCLVLLACTWFFWCVASTLLLALSLVVWQSGKGFAASLLLYRGRGMKLTSKGITLLCCLRLCAGNARVLMFRCYPCVYVY
jgi:hypothetical protein